MKSIRQYATYAALALNGWLHDITNDPRFTIPHKRRGQSGVAKARRAAKLRKRRRW
ncbi:MAG: hypothetical protein WC455_16725 [Dehalococcoidia bacterium]|jgi:hypothetical protein